jgi:hypothetical protein
MLPDGIVTLGDQLADPGQQGLAFGHGIFGHNIIVIKKGEKPWS